MDALMDIRSKYGADKLDHYIEMYEAMLSPRRQDALRLLEIGIQYGGSIRMWREFFPNATIFAVDVDPYCKERVSGVSGCEAYILDQSSQNAWERFIGMTGGAFDLVIDDGGHTMEQQINTFAALFPCLNRSGLYILEDVGTSYFPSHGGGPIGAQWTTIAMLKQLVDSVNLADACSEHAAALGDEQRKSLMQGIKALHFYLSIAVVEKE
jgi:hypothetical protein